MEINYIDKNHSVKCYVNKSNKKRNARFENVFYENYDENPNIKLESIEDKRLSLIADPLLIEENIHSVTVLIPEDNRIENTLLVDPLKIEENIYLPNDKTENESLLIPIDSVIVKKNENETIENTKLSDPLEIKEKIHVPNDKTKNNSLLIRAFVREQKKNLHCAINHCNVSSLTHENETFISFPTFGTSLYKIWIDILNLKNENTTKVICKSHFSADSFCAYGSLKRYAVPKLNITLSAINLDLISTENILSIESNQKSTDSRISDEHFNDKESVQEKSSQSPIICDKHLSDKESFQKKNNDDINNKSTKSLNNPKTTKQVISVSLKSCLICLKNKGNVDIYSKTNSNISPVEKIVFFTDITIKQDDNLSNVICERCVIRVNNAYILKKQFQTSVNFFKNIVYNTKVSSGQSRISSRLDKIITKVNDTSNSSQNASGKENYIINEKEKYNYENYHNVRENSNSIIVDEIEKNEQVTIENTKVNDTTNSIQNVGGNKTFKTLCNIMNSIYNEHAFIQNYTTSLSPQNRNNICYDDENDKHDICANTALNLSDDSVKKLNNRKSFICKICNRKFSSIFFLQHKHVITKCKICDEPFLSYSSRIEHEKTHPKSTYTCPCPKTFKKKNPFEIHIKKYHSNLKIDTNEEEPYECNICNKKFKHKIRLMEHEKWHKTKNQYTVICEICSKQYRTNVQLTTHKLMHESPKFKCECCDKMFHTKCLSRVHQMKVHSGKRYPCDLCPNAKTYSSIQVLAQHKKNVHLGIKKYKCIICEKEFFNLYNYQIHLRVHTGERPYSCKFCDRKYIARTLLYDHLEKKHDKIIRRVKKRDNKTYECHICQKSFSNISYMKFHIKSHSSNLLTSITKNGFQCRYCNEIFKYASVRITHEIRKHRSRTPFKCSICQKYCENSSKLTVHIRSHTGEKPFQCYCGRTFMTSGNLKIHNRIHTGEKLFPCNQCDAKYDRLKYLKIHVEKKHTAN